MVSVVSFLQLLCCSGPLFLWHIGKLFPLIESFYIFLNFCILLRFFLIINIDAILWLLTNFILRGFRFRTTFDLTTLCSVPVWVFLSALTAFIILILLVRMNSISFSISSFADFDSFLFLSYLWRVLLLSSSVCDVVGANTSIICICNFRIVVKLGKLLNPR